MNDTKVYALYLPQYYETEYNSDWWGQGYTEWTACKQAKPLFDGHKQPKIPLNNHFYDLSNKEEIEWQVELAKKYGIDGFIIYQYYSCNDSEYGKKNGKHGSVLLNVPTEKIRDNKDISISYCLYWANHDWRKQWFGEDPTMLWAQTYGDENDWREFYNYNRSFFVDERYIRINNKPVFLIFQPWHFRELDKFIECWNAWAKEDGFDGIYFVKTEDAHTKPGLEGFDALYRREPFYSFQKGFGNVDLIKRIFRTRFLTLINKILLRYRKGFINYTCEYEKIWKSILNREDYNSKLIPGAIAGWDNTARKGYNAQILLNSTPDLFYRYFGELYEKCKKNEVPFIIINAWNEWGEGAYLEPDTEYGFKYLETILRIKKETNLYKDI